MADQTTVDEIVKLSEAWMSELHEAYLLPAAHASFAREARSHAHEAITEAWPAGSHWYTSLPYSLERWAAAELRSAEAKLYGVLESDAVTRAGLVKNDFIRNLERAAGLSK